MGDSFIFRHYCITQCVCVGARRARERNALFPHSGSLHMSRHPFLESVNVIFIFRTATYVFRNAYQCCLFAAISALLISISPLRRDMGCRLPKLRKAEETQSPGNIYSTLRRPQVETKVGVSYTYHFLDFLLGKEGMDGLDSRVIFLVGVTQSV